MISRYSGFILGIAKKYTIIAKDIPKKEVVKEIEVNDFSNLMAQELGLTIFKLAEETNQTVTLQIDRLNNKILLCIND
jgi:hypothetical protein